LLACALALLLTALKRVDLPTFGSPTIPACKAIMNQFATGNQQLANCLLPTARSFSAAANVALGIEKESLITFGA
jgi:hypothetical protein